MWYLQGMLGSCDLDVRILLSSDSSDWLVVANSNQDCESAFSFPVLFGEDVDASCDLKYVTMTTTIYYTYLLSLASQTHWVIVVR